MINNISRMPDAYDKRTGSNLYTLLSLAYEIALDMQTDFNDINDSRDLSNAYGETLDNYGAALGVSRNGANDEQYRIKIRIQIANNISGSDCNSIIQLMAQTFSVDVSDIAVFDADNAKVVIYGPPLSAVGQIGLTPAQIKETVFSMLPIGVGIETEILTGTFEFGASYTQDEETGFGNVEQTIGGTLGEIV